MSERTNIPVMLEVAGQRCVVVGGGPVGLRRATSLAEANAEVAVVSLQMEPGLARLASERSNVVLVERAFKENDLKDAFLVVIATNSDEANRAARRAAMHYNVLMDGAHASQGSDFTFMGCERRGPLTIAVHTDGASANAAKQIRQALVEQLDPDWPAILEHAAAARQELYAIQDASLRRKAMLELVNPAAIQTYKSGGSEGLKSLYRQITEQAKLADRARQ
jgi:precorrin-2 dehydrogenase/sirohydrochlorin ferrochelatase